MKGEGGERKERREREGREKRIAVLSGQKYVKLHFIERKTPENLYMSDFFCIFARFLWAKGRMIAKINN